MLKLLNLSMKKTVHQRCKKREGVCMYCLLLVALLLGSNVLFGMEGRLILGIDAFVGRENNLLTKEKLTTFKTIITENHSLDFDYAVPKIRALMNTCSEKKCLSEHDAEWCSILGSKKCVGKLLDCVPGKKEVAAAFLGTPGAIKWGKEYITKNSQAKKNLKCLLCDIVRWTEERFVWPDEDKDVVEAILDMGVNVNTVDKGDVGNDNPGCAPIITAAAKNRIKVVTLLLDRGADIETSDPWDGRTPFMSAALNGHNEILDLLLQRKANINAYNCLGKTALMYAVYNRHVKTIEKLIAAGINIHLVDERGKTALELAESAAKSFTQFGETYNIIIKLLEDVEAVEKAKKKNVS